MTTDSEFDTRRIIFIFGIVIGAFLIISVSCMLEISYTRGDLYASETQQTPLADFLEEEGRNLMLEDNNFVCPEGFTCFKNVSSENTIPIGANSICQKLWWEETYEYSEMFEGCYDYDCIKKYPSVCIFCNITKCERSCETIRHNFTEGRYERNSTGHEFLLCTDEENSVSEVFTYETMMSQLCEHGEK